MVNLTFSYDESIIKLSGFLQTDMKLYLKLSANLKKKKRKNEIIEIFLHNETFLVENHSGNSSKKILLIILIREKNNNVHLVQM